MKKTKLLWAALVAVVAFASCSEDGNDDDPNVVAGTIIQINYTCVDSDTDSCIYYLTYDNDGRITQVETSVYKSYEFGAYEYDVKYGKRKMVYTYASDKITIQDYESYGDTADNLCDYEEDGTAIYGLNSDGSLSYIDDYNYVDGEHYAYEYTYTDGYLTKQVVWGYHNFLYEWNNGSILNASYNDGTEYSFSIGYSNCENNANIDINTLVGETFWLENFIAGDVLGKRSDYLIGSSNLCASDCEAITKNVYTTTNDRVSKVEVYYTEYDEDNDTSREPQLEDIYEFTYAE
ncbi:MAG: hypothetical protein R3Y68_05310 [Rikenellaceae bacterium]